MDKRKFWKFCGLVCLATTILVIVYLTYFNPSLTRRRPGSSSLQDEIDQRDRCSLLDVNAYSKRSSDPISRASPDNKILVELSAHLQYLGSGVQQASSLSDQLKVYLPLKLQRVSLVNEANGASSLGLISDCARITLNLATDSKELVVGTIDIETIASGGSKRECHVLQTPIRLDYSNKYYSCNISSQYPCVALHWKDKASFVTETVALLYLDYFKFELDGNPNVIVTNQFSKSPSYCYT